MSSRRFRPFLYALVAAATITVTAAGFAGAASLEGMLDGALQASAAPALLGPITESGRKGWACKPEQAATAHSAQGAELPTASDNR